MLDKRQKVPNKVENGPASQAEKSYALKLGIVLPENATQSDAKALIARDLDGEEGASEGLLSYARNKGMLCSDYIGNKALHNQLFDNLSELDKVIFFCFCIYKFYWEDENENLLEHPDRSVFESFGEKFVRDGYFMLSMEEYLGEELVAFGKSKKVINGKEKTIYGGSAYTRANKEAYQYLKEHLLR